MKKSLFALALAACFAFGTSEFEALEKECNDGNMKSCAEAGLQCKDNAKKLKLFEKACNGGNKLGCLGVSGIMMQEDPKKAVEYFEKKCDSGDALDCALLGAMYKDGDGVEKDISKAVIYYDKACDRGNGLACAMLAEMYGNGDGVKMDAVRQQVYYKKGCDVAGELLNCYNFAIFNHYVEKDKSKAAQYYKKACNSGKNSSYLDLSNMTELKNIWQKSCDMYELLK